MASLVYTSLWNTFGSKSQTGLGPTTEWIIWKKQKETLVEPEVVGCLQCCLLGHSVEIHTFAAAGSAKPGSQWELFPRNPVALDAVVL